MSAVFFGERGVYEFIILPFLFCPSSFRTWQNDGGRMMSHTLSFPALPSMTVAPRSVGFGYECSIPKSSIDKVLMHLSQLKDEGSI